MSSGGRNDCLVNCCARFISMRTQQPPVMDMPYLRDIVRDTSVRVLFSACRPRGQLARARMPNLHALTEKQADKIWVSG